MTCKYKPCSGLKDVYCFATSILETSSSVFQDVLLASATLHVPASALEDYKSTAPWSNFGNIVPIGTFYKLTYMVDGEEYLMQEVEEGTKVTAEEEPTKEGYVFSGWNEIPETMPSHDVTITGTFTLVDGISSIGATEKAYDIYTLDGRRVETLQKGINILRKGKDVKKVFVK